MSLNHAKQIFSSVASYLTRDTSHDAASTRDSTSPKDTSSRPTRSNANDLGTSGSEAMGVKKRMAEGELEHAGPRKRRLYQGHRGLTPDYRTRKNAVAISIPQGDGDMAEEQSKMHAARNAAGRLPRPHRQGIQPKNTLNAQPHAANGAKAFHGAPDVTNGQSRAPVKRTITNSMGTSRLGDGFEDHERESRPRAKKRKLDLEHASPSRQADSSETIAIDLTGNEPGDSQEIVESKVTKLNGKPVKDWAKDQPHVNDRTSPLKPFEGNEYDNVNRRVRLPEKPTRRSKEGRPSDQESSRGTPGASLGSPRPSLFREDDDVVEVDFPSSPPNIKPAHTNPRNSGGNAKSKPEIDLTSGFENCIPRVKKTGGENEVDDRSAEMERFKNNPFPSSRLTSPLQAQPRQPRRQIRQDKTSEPPKTNRQSARPLAGHSEKLNDKFKRDNGSSSQQETPPRPPERPSPISDDSPDELAGDGNSISPRKENTSVDFDPANRRAGSAYVKGHTKSVRKVERKHHQPDEDRCPIEAFYAASCVAKSGDIELQYVPDEHMIYVCQDGAMLRVADKSRVVAIGDEDVDKFVWDQDHKEYKVCIKGPNRDNNSGGGFICLVFNSDEGLNWAINTLVDINEMRIAAEAISTERLVKTFNSYLDKIVPAAKRKQRFEPFEAVEAQSLKRRSIEAPAGVRVTASSRRNIRSQDLARRSNLGDEEQILYEPSPHFLETRRSSRRDPATSREARSPTLPQKWTKVNNLPKWPHSVVYPPEGPKRVTVDFQDLERLDEDEFLNDNIVGFALRQIEETMSSEQRENVFFFNTFFYTALSTKDGKKTFNYDAVKRWTKKIDLLNTPYIVVPINLHLHWFVAIICNLTELARKPSAMDSEEAGDAVEVGSDDEWNVTRALDSTEKAIISQSTEAMEDLVLSDKNRDSPAGPEDADTPVGKTSSKQRKGKKKGPGPKQYKPETPIIITLDSFGSQHTAEARFLKDYIAAEAFEKRGMEVKRDDIQAMTAKGIPQQVNFSDCGVYVVGYLEQFARDPKGFVTSVLSREIDKEAGFASFNPSAKREQIRNDLLQLQKEQEEMRQATKKPVKKSTPNTAVEPKAPSNPAPPAPLASATATQPLQEEVVMPKAAVKKASSEKPQTPPTDRLPMSRASSLPAMASQGEDQEADVVKPRPLRALEKSEEVTKDVHQSDTLRTEDNEILELDESSIFEPLARELRQFAEQPPAEVADSQEAAETSTRVA